MLDSTSLAKFGRRIGNPGVSLSGDLSSSIGARKSGSFWHGWLSREQESYWQRTRVLGGVGFATTGNGADFLKGRRAAQEAHELSRPSE